MIVRMNKFRVVPSVGSDYAAWHAVRVAGNGEKTWWEESHSSKDNAVYSIRQLVYTVATQDLGVTNEQFWNMYAENCSYEVCDLKGRVESEVKLFSLSKPILEHVLTKDLPAYFGLVGV